MPILESARAMRFTRRKMIETTALAALLGACSSVENMLPETGQGESLVQQPNDKTAVRVGLLLPMTGPNMENTAQSLRNGAQMALADFGASNPIQLLLMDDRGTPEGARIAAQQALAAGAEVILGPVMASSVTAAAQVTRQAGKPMIAFSSDKAVAQPGVYVMGFIPQADVQRMIGFAASRGKKAFAALLPQTAYGNAIEAEFMSAASASGRRVTSVARYAPGAPEAGVAQLRSALSQSDTLMLAEGAEGLGGLLNALSSAGISSRQVQFIAPAIWQDSRVFTQSVLDGAWFAAPDTSRFNAFAARYQAQFNQAPPRIATLGYDAATLAAALAQNFGSERFSERTLTNPNGFSGQDGVFRFRQNGTNERGLTIYEIRGGNARVLQSAPAAF